MVSPEIIRLLKSTLWGTPGLTQYQHIETEKTIFDIGSPQFFSLERNNRLLCTLCLAGRKVNIENTLFESHYVRYLAAHSSLNGKRKRKLVTGLNGSRGLVKRFMEEVFKFGPSAEVLNQNLAKTVYYAYVETENEQSIRLCNHFGFKKVSSMETVSFSRFSPKKHESVRHAEKTEYNLLQKAILEQNAGHNFVNLEHVFYNNDYFVYKLNGEIVAGVQANPMCWAFRNLPGFSGKILLKALPRVPYLKRLINPNRFSFSAFEGIFCKPGFEWVLNSLFESVLAVQGNYTALIWLDVQSPLIKCIRKNCKLGLMDKINSNGGGDILVRGENLTEAEWKSMIEKPMYVSSFDFN